MILRINYIYNYLNLQRGLNHPIIPYDINHILLIYII